jgi:hypothetical protein
MNHRTILNYLNLSIHLTKMIHILGHLSFGVRFMKQVRRNRLAFIAIFVVWVAFLISSPVGVVDVSAERIGAGGSFGPCTDADTKDNSTTYKLTNETGVILATPSGNHTVSTASRGQTTQTCEAYTSNDTATYKQTSAGALTYSGGSTCTNIIGGSKLSDVITLKSAASNTGGDTSATLQTVSGSGGRSDACKLSSGNPITVNVSASSGSCSNGDSFTLVPNGASLTQYACENGSTTIRTYNNTGDNKTYSLMTGASGCGDGYNARITLDNIPDNNTKSVGGNLTQLTNQGKGVCRDGVSNGITVTIQSVDLSSIEEGFQQTALSYATKKCDAQNAQTGGANAYTDCLKSNLATFQDAVNACKVAGSSSISDIAKCLVDSGKFSEVKDLLTAMTTSAAGTSCAIENIGWLVCPAISFMATIADSAFSFLSDNFLQVDSKTVSSSGSTYQAWKIMRDFANVAFVIAFLIIIFSQLTGQGIANYGIKKMLPRLVVAAVLVNVSFFVCQVAVDLSNILGVGLNQLFKSVGGGVNLPAGAVAGDDSGNWVGIAMGVLAATSIAWALGVTVLLPFLLGAVIALIMVFLILVIRQMLIILLIVLAPIAFVAFLLPNTEQWFTKWRKMFVGLLLVFPLIGLLFGAAGLASTILKTATYSATDTKGTIGGIVAAGIVALPLFLLPGLLKKSLDAAGNIGGTLNKMSDKFSKGSKNTLGNSGIMKSLANRKQTKRAQIGAGIYSGKNPVSMARSAMNKRLNKSGAYNALTGNYGTIRGANIDKLEGEETKLAEAAVQLQARSGQSLESQFKDAVRSGDTVKAKAAQNLLMKQGGSGVSSVRKVLRSEGATMNEKMSSALASNITENHGQIAKQKGADVLQWAKNGGGAHIDAVGASPDTWSSLSARDLADQSDDAFRLAMQSGAVSAETMRNLNSDRIMEGMSDAKKTALTTARIVPQTVAPTPSATREFSRQQVQAMGVDNTTAAVAQRGGIQALNDGDVLSIANAHGGTPIGQQARDEVTRRNIRTSAQPKTRDSSTMPKQ